MVRTAILVTRAVLAIKNLRRELILLRTARVGIKVGATNERSRLITAVGPAQREPLYTVGKAHHRDNHLERVTV